MKKLFFILYITVGVVSCTSGDQKKWAQHPPMGWNSFDSYGVYLHEDAAFANLEAFAQKLKPAGYQYFVIDAGWFGEFRLYEGTLFPRERHAEKLNTNEYGLLQPSRVYFPNGFGKLIERCHELGLKFGLHLMRGIPKQAVHANVRIKGTSYHAQDIADTMNVCKWCPQNYGVDMSRPGAQEFYDSLIRQMADWGVDFIKYDDIVPYPAEVQAVVEAIAKCGRPIVLSLSPGGFVKEEAVDTYRTANMLRVTKDIWDDQKGIDRCFDAWRKWQGVSGDGFWIDMDMIPFGQLKLMSPMPEGLQGGESRAEFRKMQASGKLDVDARFDGNGYHRWSLLTQEQMKTFITLRSMSASPLMVGGDLPSMDAFSLSLLTNPEMIACNQNGIMGHLCHESDSVEVWRTPAQTGDEGWIGIFNRSSSPRSAVCQSFTFGLDSTKDYRFHDIWKDTAVESLNFSIPAHGVIFLTYKNKRKSNINKY